MVNHLYQSYSEIFPAILLILLLEDLEYIPQFFLLFAWISIGDEFVDA